MSELVKTERQGFIATVTLNRPDKHNAISQEMWKQLTNEIEALSFDDTLRCIIVRGEGKHAFSTGYDISEFETLRADKKQGMAFGLVSHTAMATLASCPHPLVAQIHGLCVGGGLIIAALCDIRICGESSRFGIPANKLGATLAFPEITPIMRLTGPDVALELLLEGRTFGAQEAKEKRLVSRIVPDEKVGRGSTSHSTAHRRERTACRALAQKIRAPTKRWQSTHDRRVIWNASPVSTPRIIKPDACRSCKRKRPNFLGASRLILQALPVRPRERVLR